MRCFRWVRAYAATPLLYVVVPFVVKVCLSPGVPRLRRLLRPRVRL
jgi:hypothetical protein